MNAPFLAGEKPRYCPHCGIGGKWWDKHEDGIECIFCGCIVYEAEPLGFVGRGTARNPKTDRRKLKNNGKGEVNGRDK